MPTTRKDIKLYALSRADQRAVVVDEKRQLFGGKSGNYIEPDAGNVDLVLIHMMAEIRTQNNSSFGRLTLHDVVNELGLDIHAFADNLGRDLTETMSELSYRIGLVNDTFGIGTLIGAQFLVPFIAGELIRPNFEAKVFIGLASPSDRIVMANNKLYVPKETLSLGNRDQLWKIGDALGRHSNLIRTSPDASMGSY